MARAACKAVAFTLASSMVQAKLLEVGPLMMTNSSAMLTEIEGMVRSGEAPAFQLVTAIKSLILDDIMPDLQATQDAAAQATAEALNDIESCNNASKQAEGMIAGSEEVSVNDKRSLHAVCREDQKVKYYHNLTNVASYCVKLGKFLHRAERLHINRGLGRIASVGYVKSASDTNLCDNSAVTDLDSGCTAKEQQLSDIKADCLTKQGQFELAFCTWKTKLELNCKALETCHSDAVTFYNDHVSKTQTLVAKWNVETAALHKILCYCSVWLSEKDEGDQRSRHNATQFETCKAETYTSADVNYGTAAAKVACLLTSVANHPGTTGFGTHEFSNFTDFVESVVPCL